MSAPKVELWPVERIRLYEGNPRCNDRAVDAVARSLREFGFRQPIVVDAEGMIVVGETRWKAAKRLKLAKVPVHVAEDLTPEQARAYRIADNKTGEIAEWDFDLLPIELAALRDADVDLGLLGFDAGELARLLGSLVGDPDAVPEPPDDPKTKPGDLYQLGDHRLLCGDAGSQADVDRLLDGEPIHLVNTDPPYNVNVEPRSRNAIAAGNSTFAAPQPAKAAERKMRAKDRPLVNDFVSDEQFDELLLAWFGHIARVLLPGRGFYIWGGYTNIGCYPPALKACGLYFSQAIIWHKMHPVLTRKDFMGDHEWCFYGWREGAAHKFFGPANVPDVWSVKKVNPQAMMHLTEKPVELAARAIDYSSRPGENVLDLFGGSGSTLIAAEQYERQAFMMEIDPAYCDVIVQRWEECTGHKAKRTRRGRR